MGVSINGSTGGGASAPSGSGVVTASGGAFVSPVASAATTRATLGVVATPNATPSNVIAGATAGGVLITDASGNATVATGTAGYALVSNGAGVAPTFQSLSTPTWLSLYGATALYMGSDSTTGWATTDRINASAAAAAPAFGPGQSLVLCLYPTATPTGQELMVCHVVSPGTRGWYVAVGNNAGARRRLSIFMAGLNGSADLYLTGSDFTVGSPYVIAICVKADKSVRYSVNGGAVQTIAALTGTYVPPTSADTLRIGSTNDFAPTYYAPVSEFIGAMRTYSTELSDADLVAACAGRTTATIPDVATGTVSTAFSALAFAGGLRVVTQTGVTWIAAGTPSIHTV